MSRFLWFTVYVTNANARINIGWALKLEVAMGEERQTATFHSRQ